MSESGNSDLGSYAVNSEANCPWITLTQMTRCAQRLRQSKPSVKVTSLLFDQMTEYISDDYWIGVFKRMSTGRMPKGFKVVGPELTHRKRGKIYSMILPKQPDRVDEVIDFFHECGVYSHTDEELNRQNHRSRVSEYKAKSLKWGDISRNKRLLEQALVVFAKKKIQEAGLGEDAFLELYQLLKLAALLRALTPANVVVENDDIAEIRVLIFDPASKSWNINFNVPWKQKAKAKPREKDSIASRWQCYYNMIKGEPAAEKRKSKRDSEITTEAAYETAETNAAELTEQEDATELE